MSNGAKLIFNERTRQVTSEGFDKNHDLQHVDNELTFAAIHYASPETVYVKREYKNNNDENMIIFKEVWPSKWHRKWDKKSQKTKIKNLVTAGALLSAEIDRLLENFTPEEIKEIIGE